MNTVLGQGINNPPAPQVALHDATPATMAALAGSNNVAFLPVLTTEHQAHTNSQWNTLVSNGDSPFEASRLANQIMSQASLGYEARPPRIHTHCCAPLTHRRTQAYIFKFSSGTSVQGGITKSGIHWGENSAAPYPIGDTNLAGEAAAQMIPYLINAKTLGTCAFPTALQAGSQNTNYLVSGVYLFCVVVQDGPRRHIIIINDMNGLGASGGSVTAAAPSGDPSFPAPAGIALTLTFDLSGMNIPLGSYVAINEVSSPSYWGETSYLGALSSSLLTRVLPPFGVMRITTSNVAQQHVGGVGIAVPCTGAATLVAGANSARNFGSQRNLYVGTSVSSVHDTTSVAILKFDISAVLNAAGNANNVVLEVTASQVTSNSEASVLSVVGINPCTGTAWDDGSITWNAASFVVSPPVGPITMILNNFVQLDGIDPGNDFCGHITVQAADAGAVKRVDVTDYVRTAARGGATTVAFLLARRFRSNGVCVGTTTCPNSCSRGVCTLGKGNAAGPYAADDLDAGASVGFFSDASATNPPLLRILADTTFPAAAAYTPTSVLCPKSPPPPSPAPPSPKAPVRCLLSALRGMRCFAVALRGMLRYPRCFLHRSKPLCFALLCFACSRSLC